MNFTSRVYRVAIRYSISKERNFRIEIKQDDPEGFRRDLTDEALQRQINLTRKLQSRKLREHK